MADAVALGIDSGGTATRWCLARVGGAVAQGSVAPLTGHVFTDAARTAATAILRDIALGVEAHARPTHILAGITGLGPSSGVAGLFRDALARLFDLPQDRVRVVEDIWLGYRAFFAPGEGILVYAGTGSVGFHLTRAGETLRAGGRGILVDDAGSGAWIGQRGLRAVLRLEDEAVGQGWRTALGQAIGAVIGTPAWDTARDFVYGGGRSSLGALAPAVAAAAAGGDAAAAAIMKEAGGQLARLALALRRRVGAKPVVLSGRAAFLHPRIAEDFAERVPAPLALAESSPDAALTAARIALADDGV